MLFKSFLSVHDWLEWYLCNCLHWFHLQTVYGQCSVCSCRSWVASHPCRARFHRYHCHSPPHGRKIMPYLQGDLILAAIEKWRIMTKRSMIPSSTGMRSTQRSTRTRKEMSMNCKMMRSSKATTSTRRRFSHGLEQHCNNWENQRFL